MTYHGASLRRDLDQLARDLARLAESAAPPTTAAEPTDGWWARQAAAWNVILAAMPAEYAARVVPELAAGATVCVGGQPSALAVRVHRMAVRWRHAQDPDPWIPCIYRGPHVIPAATCQLLTELVPDEGLSVLFSYPVCPGCAIEVPQRGWQTQHYPERYPTWRAAGWPPERFFYFDACPHCGEDLAVFEAAARARRAHVADVLQGRAGGNRV